MNGSEATERTAEEISFLSLLLFRKDFFLTSLDSAFKKFAPFFPKSRIG